MTLTEDDVMALPESDFKALFGMMMRRISVRRARWGKRVSVSSILAGLAVGESHLFAGWTGCNRLKGADKFYARERLVDPSARWIARCTNQGVRVTRVA